MTSLRVASISRARPPENLKYQSPARSQIFAMEKISAPRERRRKWSPGLRQHLKAGHFFYIYIYNSLLKQIDIDTAN